MSKANCNIQSLKGLRAGDFVHEMTRKKSPCSHTIADKINIPVNVKQGEPIVLNMATERYVSIRAVDSARAHTTWSSQTLSYSVLGAATGAGMIATSMWFNVVSLGGSCMRRR